MVERKGCVQAEHARRDCHILEMVQGDIDRHMQLSEENLEVPAEAADWASTRPPSLLAAGWWISVTRPSAGPPTSRRATDAFFSDSCVQQISVHCRFCVTPRESHPLHDLRLDLSGLPMMNPIVVLLDCTEASPVEAEED